MKILVVRFRQMGDAILSTVILNTLRLNFPDATIDFVLNARIAHLFEGHPSIDHVVSFSEKECRNAFSFIRKVWQVVHRTHYDVVVDMRSTANTALFSLFSMRSAYRIGLKKHYCSWAYNYSVERSRTQNIIDYDLSLLRPLERVKPLTMVRAFTLPITHQEIAAFKDYMQACGIDFRRPRLLIGVTAKLASKCWPEDYMVALLQRLLDTCPDAQLIFNYAPGEEETHARRIYQRLNSDPRILINLKAGDMRELCAMAHNVSIYFGNEGGARHVVHAAGVPSFVIMAPQNRKARWLPQNDVPAEGIDVTDVMSAEQIASTSYEQQYAALTPERVWAAFYRAFGKMIEPS